MRAITAEAGVSVGNAYYYFDSKEHLIQAFYDRAQHEHLAAARPASARRRAPTWAASTSSGWRRRGSTPWRSYKPFAGKFFKNRPSRPARSARSARVGAGAHGGHRPLAGSARRVRRPRCRGGSARSCPSLLLAVTSWGWCCSGSTTAPAQRTLRHRSSRCHDGADGRHAAIEVSRLPAMRSMVDDLTALLADLRTFAAASVTAG